MTARIAPVEPPFDPEIQERLDKIMPPGVPPLALFATIARDKRLFERFMAGGLVDKGNLARPVAYTSWAHEVTAEHAEPRSVLLGDGRGPHDS